MLTPWLKQDEFGKNRFSIDSCSRCCILSEKQQSVSAADIDRLQENSERIFSEQMFSAFICLSFLPWSTLNLKEKSGRVILACEYSRLSFAPE